MEESRDEQNEGAFSELFRFPIPKNLGIEFQQGIVILLHFGFSLEQTKYDLFRLILFNSPRAFRHLQATVPFRPGFIV